MSNHHRSNDILDDYPPDDVNHNNGIDGNDDTDDNSSVMSLNENDNNVPDSDDNHYDDNTSNAYSSESSVEEEEDDDDDDVSITSTNDNRLMEEIMEEVANYSDAPSSDDDSAVPFGRRRRPFAHDFSDDDDSEDDDEDDSSNDSSVGILPRAHRDPELFIEHMIGRMTETAARLQNLELAQQAEQSEADAFRRRAGAQTREATVDWAIVPPSAEAFEASYQFLQYMLQDEEPGMYVNLPDELKADVNMAQAALLGTTKWLDGEENDDYIYCDIIKELCQNRPEVLCLENNKPLFLQALERVDDMCFFAECVMNLNERGIVDDVYQELCRVFLLDNTKEQLFWEECYVGLLDVSWKCHPFVTRRFLETNPSKEMLQAIPPEAQLSEEHFIRAVKSLYRNDFQLDQEEGAAFELSDIPEEFPKSRQIYAHLKNLLIEANNDNDEDPFPRFRRRFDFSIPQDLCTDRSVCLACLPGCTRSEFPKVWRSIDKSLRKQKSFFLKAIALNLQLYSVLRERSKEFDVWLAATAAHGYRDVLLTLKRHPIELIEVLEKRLEGTLGRFGPFWVFLQGVSSENNNNNNPINLLRMDPETSTLLKQEIAEYAGVPTGSYLATLRRVWVMRHTFYRDFQENRRRRRRLNHEEDPFLRKLYRRRRVEFRD